MSHEANIQDLLASLGAKFGSALADIFQTEFLRILAEHISDGGLTPATDTVLLLTAYRSGSHLTSDIKVRVILACKRKFYLLDIWRLAISEMKYTKSS